MTDRSMPIPLTALLAGSAADATEPIGAFDGSAAGMVMVDG